MSNQSFGQQSDGQRANHTLQSDPIPFTVQTPPQLAQFAAATASNYYPKPQTNPTTLGSGFNTTNTSHQAKPTTTTPQSDFAKSAYATAEHGSSGLRPPPAQPIDLNTFKGLKFVTLDSFLIETREIYDKISGTFQWEMCESQDDRCLTYIRDKCADRRVFLISSGSLGRKVVPSIHDLPQIYAIYIYCADVQYNQEWANKYSKIRVVCNNDDEYLLPQLAVDVAQADSEWGDAFVKQGKRDKAKEKYQKALENLTQYAKYPLDKPIKQADPLMVNAVKSKLEECK